MTLFCSTHIFAAKASEEQPPNPAAPLLARLYPDSSPLQTTCQVRDEAHRFAVAYHRKLRGKDLFLPERVVGESDGVGGRGGRRQRGFETIPGVLRAAAFRAVRLCAYGVVA